MILFSVRVEYFLKEDLFSDHLETNILKQIVDID